MLLQKQQLPKLTAPLLCSSTPGDSQKWQKVTKQHAPDCFVKKTLFTGQGAEPQNMEPSLYRMSSHAVYPTTIGQKFALLFPSPFLGTTQLLYLSRVKRNKNPQVI